MKDKNQPKIAISVRVDRELYNKLVMLAKKECRSLSNTLHKILTSFLGTK